MFGWGQKCTKYNKINNNSEKFRGARFLLGEASLLLPLALIDL